MCDYTLQEAIADGNTDLQKEKEAEKESLYKFQEALQTTDFTGPKLSQEITTTIRDRWSQTRLQMQEIIDDFQYAARILHGVRTIERGYEWDTLKARTDRSGSGWRAEKKTRTTGRRRARLGGLELKLMRSRPTPIKRSTKQTARSSRSARRPSRSTRVSLIMPEAELSERRRETATSSAMAGVEDQKGNALCSVDCL